MNNWETYEFEKAIFKNNIGRDNQINSANILNNGLFPVIDQGQEFIAGYTNQKEKLISKGLPYVIFGDHTRCLKYIDFPFVVGADGTKVISPNKALFDPKFFFFQLQSLHIQNRGYNRHYTLLKEKLLLRPSLPEQRKIAYVLNTIQQAIEKQVQLIHTTTELRKTLMQKLFTQGLHGEPQKETEIGLVPESWEIVSIGKAVTRWFGGGTPSTKNNEYWQGNNPWITSKWLSEKIEIYNGEKFISDAGIINSATSIVPAGSLIFATRVGVGKIGISNIDISINQDLAGGQLDKKFDCHYIAYQYQTHRVQSELESYKRGATIKGITRENLKSIYLAIPSTLKEQQEISNTIKSLSSKIKFHQKKKQTLSELFKTILHQLMTGQIRVNEIEFNNIAKEYKLVEEPLSMVAEP